MLERTRNVRPKTVRSQNALIDAMEQKETIIYITGQYADEVKANILTKSKTAKGFSKAYKVLGVISVLLNPALALACFGISGFVSLGDDFKNYKIEIDENKNRIILTKTKGKNAYRPKLDTIVE